MEIGCAMVEKTAHSHAIAMTPMGFKVGICIEKQTFPEARKDYFTSIIVSTQSRKCISFESMSAVITYTPFSFGA
jgi:uncharacterized iron-regulated protein